MNLLTLLVVGLVAGVLASLTWRGGYGLIMDIIIGVAGAFVGSWGFHRWGARIPVHGLPGITLVALAGAVVLLYSLRFVRRNYRT